MAADKAQAQPAAPSQEELRELMLHGETLRQQLSALEQQRELLADLVGEARRALAALDHLATAKDGDEILLPLGAGAYVHARLGGEGRAIASLGSGVHAELPVPEAQARMKDRLENLEGANAALAKDAQRLAGELDRVNAVLEPYLG